MIERTELTATLDEHQKAFTEVSFLLDVLAETITQVVGNSTASLGISAGKHMAKKMPIYLDKPSFEEVLTALIQKMQNGFEITFQRDEGGASLEFGRCSIGDVCENRSLERGGKLCSLFHYYFAGMCAELYGKPVRASKAAAGSDKCSLRLDAR